MKRIIALCLVTLFLSFALVGCGDMDRFNYVKGLKDYVELCDVSSITVDLKSDEYMEIYNNTMSSDLKSLTFDVKEGTVENGDITNIDFEGKVDGVPFEGGTAAGHELTIGSGDFIPGFEEQLIGVKIGDTVDIKVTFPADYHDPTLAGVDAVFTVTVNSIKRHYSEVNEEFASAAGYDSTDAYLKELEEGCVRNYIYSYIINNSTVKELPPDKHGNGYNYYKQYYTRYAESNGGTFESFLSYNGMDEAAFKSDILTSEVIMYACFDVLGLVITDEAVNAKVEEIAKNYNTTVDEVKNVYGDNYIESIYVNDTVVETLYEKATIVK